MKQYKNILIIKMSSLGDILHALPTLYALRQNCPKAKITWAVHPQYVSLLPGKPFLDDIIEIDKKKLKKISYLMELRKELHHRNFDMVLDLQCLAKSAVVSFLSGADERYGYWETREGSGLVNKGLKGSHQYDHVIERYLDTIRVLGGTVQSIEFPLPDLTREKERMGEVLGDCCRNAGYVAIVPGARWNIKEWPLDNWAALCRTLTSNGLHVVLLGSKEDREKGRHIRQVTGSDRVVDLTGKTSLKELMAVIDGSLLYISADTGPLHIANALKKELIALFGPTCPERTGPYGGEHVHILISPASKATPEHPLVEDAECMQYITPDKVWDLCKKVLEKK